MKKLFLLFATVLFLYSCTSKEEKAQELIKNDMYKTLFDFESYEPIETIIDSAYYSVYTDTAFLNKGYRLAAILKILDENIDEIKDAQTTMNIWGDSYTALGRSKYNEAKAKADSRIKTSKIFLALTDSISSQIKDMAKATSSNFIGWKATHKFRCKTKGGQSTIGDYIYVFDKDIKEIIYKEDTEDEDLEKAKKLIKEALNKKETEVNE